MQQPQLAAAQIGLAAMGVEQRDTALPHHQGHGVDAEIPARQIIRQAAESHAGILPGCGINLVAGTGQIQQQRPLLQVQFQFGRAIGGVLAVAEDTSRSQPLDQAARQPVGGGNGGIPCLDQGRFHHQIQIRHPLPGIVMHPMQQQVPHRPTHQGQPICRRRRREQGWQGGGQSRQIQEGASRQGGKGEWPHHPGACRCPL